MQVSNTVEIFSKKTVSEKMEMLQMKSSIKQIKSVSSSVD
jgi:hypothetical protein